MNKEQDFLVIHIFTPNDHSTFNGTHSFLPTYQISLDVEVNILLAWYHWWWQFSLLWIIKILEMMLLFLIWTVCCLSNSKSSLSLAWAEKCNAEFLEEPCDGNVWVILSHSSSSRCLQPIQPSSTVINPHFSSSLECHSLWDIESESHSVLSDSLWPHGLESSWNSPGQNTRVGSLSPLQGIFPIQGSNPGLSQCRQILYQLSHKGSPRILEWVAYPFSSGSSWPRNQTGVSWTAGRFFTNWAIREALWDISTH